MPEADDISALNQQLQQEHASWQASENPITRMETSEQDQLLGFTPGEGDLSLEQAAAADMAAPTVTMAEAITESNAGAPSAFDLRDVGGKKYTTSVKNQGGCGSCVAFGTLAVMETTFQYRRRNPNTGIDLSEAHLFYCHGADDNRSCSNGWWPHKAFEYAKSKGVATEDMFPYVGSQQPCNVSAGWQDSKATSLGHTKVETRAKMKEWISTRGSLTGCFVVYSDFFAYQNGVYRRSANAQQRGGHCVEIVGYDDSLAAWICKNSWGINWGDRGFFKIGYGQCQIETWSGPWGCDGVRLRGWHTTKVAGIYSSEADRGAWVYLKNQGWRHLGDDQMAQHLLVAELSSARAGDRNVRALVDGNSVETVYVS